MISFQLKNILNFIKNLKMTSALSDIPKVTKLSSQIIRVLGCNPGMMTLQGTNSYLLGSGSKRILIDTTDPNVPLYIENLNDVLKNENASISNIILTHWHHDHVGGVKYIVENKLNKDCKVWKFPRSDAPNKCEEIPDSVEVLPLTDGQEIHIDDLTVKVFHTPGHTTDHIILTMDDGSLFSGDCILGEGTAVFEDLYEYMKSLNLILNLNPTIIYPGHGKVVKDPAAKIKYYIDHRKQREKEIFTVFQNNMEKLFNEMDIVKIVYTQTPENLWPAAAYNVNHHLKKLTKEYLLVEVIENGDTKWKYNKSVSSL